MKILKRQYYIAVDSRPDLGVESYHVKITTNLKTILREWGATTRISPIWQLRPTVNDKSLISDEISEAYSLWFLNGVSADFLRDEFPEKILAELYHESLWLSIGVHSLILVCRNKDVDEEINSICVGKVPYERWLVQSSEGPNVFDGSDIDYESPEDYFEIKEKRRGALAKAAFANSSIEADDALGFMQLELYALLSVIEGRARGEFEKLANDALAIESLASELVNGHDLEADEADGLATNGGVSRPDILLTLNAGLSRLSSQALSGTSPILRTECHFWPHSLLGTGVANLALRNVTSFLSELTNQAKFDQRIYALRDREFDIGSYELTKTDPQFPDFASISRANVAGASNLLEIEDSELEGDEVDQAVTTTPITYFSGRDGFMNGPLTTSAPLPSISGGNSYQWNLGTITHEISHRVLSGHIIDCLEDFLEDMYDLQVAGGQNCTTVLSYFQTPPKTFGEYAARVLGRALLLINYLDFSEPEMRAAMSQPFDFFFDAVDSHSEDLEELLVHIFDFYHFYGEDTENYCNFVWLSWAVQPSIEDKLLDYIVRTLVALGVKHTGRNDWKELALSDFRAVLKQEPLKSRLRIRSEVEQLLDDEARQDEIMELLDISEGLLVLFHMFFKFDPLQTASASELYSNPTNKTIKRSGLKEKRYYHYRYSNDTFVSEKPSIGRPKFSNPLVFLRDYSREEKPNAAQSAWLLHMLAFNVDFDRSEPGGHQ